jgi:hypothetical protein
LATEVSRKEIKNFYENTLKNTRLTSERNLNEFLGELETTFLSFLNNHKRKAEISNKRRLDDIEQESERNCEIIDRKSRKISEKHKDNSGNCKKFHLKHNFFFAKYEKKLSFCLFEEKI